MSGNWSGAFRRALFEAARWSASSYNEQPWSYLVARKADGKAFEDMHSCLVEANRGWTAVVPVLAIGGIDARTIDRFAGAPGIAAIRWFLPDPAGEDRLVENIAHARRALARGPSDNRGDDL